MTIIFMDIFLTQRCTKSNRNAITTLVNGRVIKNNELNKIIADAYHTYIPKG